MSHTTPTVTGADTGSEKARLERLVLRRGITPTYESVRVLVPAVEYDEALECFYVYEGEWETKTLPPNFHTHELLDVDPSSVESLLEFQRAWGLLTTPDRTPLRPGSHFVSSSVIATPTRGSDGHGDFDEALSMEKSLKERHPGFGSIEALMITEGVPRFYPFAPRGEAEAAATYLQKTCSDLVRYATLGFDNWAGIMRRNIENTVDYIDSAVAPYYPTIAVGEPGKPALPPVLPLANATLAQLVGYLTSGTGYRECPFCHRYFIYKRHGNGETGADGQPVRNRRSAYCSDDCRVRAGARRQSERRKAARHAAKGVVPMPEQ